MDTVIILSKLLGIYLVVSGLFAIFKGQTLPIVMKDFFAHRATVYLAGVFLLFLGGYILVNHYVSTVVSPTILVVMGWLILAKGIFYIFSPQTLEKITLKKLKYLMRPLGVLVIALGIWLFYLNF
jgi:uncharacterized membrane protein HdeD (DUF308 family)